MDYINNERGRRYVEFMNYEVSDGDIINAMFKELRTGELVHIVDNHWYDSLLRKRKEW